MKTKKITLIFTALILGTVFSIILNNIKGDAEKIYYDIIFPLIGGVSLIWISLNKKLKRSEIVNNNRSLKFFKKFKILFRVIGIVLLLLLFINIVLIFGWTKSGRKEWNEVLINKEIEDCIKSVPDWSKQYPKQTHDYCECAINKVKNTTSYKEYIDSLKTPTPSGALKLTPIIQDCIDIFSNSISVIKQKK